MIPFGLAELPISKLVEFVQFSHRRLLLTVSLGRGTSWLLLLIHKVLRLLHSLIAIVLLTILPLFPQLFGSLNLFPLLGGPVVDGLRSASISGVGRLTIQAYSGLVT